jgi:hypothetical protein
MLLRWPQQPVMCPPMHSRLWPPGPSSLHTPELGLRAMAPLAGAAGVDPSSTAGDRHGRVAATRLMAPVVRKRLPGGPVKLHLGCGFEPLSGWVNIDEAGSRAAVIWDLRRGLPYPDGSVTAEFHEHMLEHMPRRRMASLHERA